MNVLGEFVESDILWVDVVGCEEFYQVSNTGLVKSKVRRYSMPNGGFVNRGGSILKGKIDKYGYLSFHLRVNKKSKHATAHRLVAIAFLGHKENLQINHIDGNKLNNHIDNLEWCTSSENLKHAYLHKLKNQDGEKNPQAKLSNCDIIEIRSKLKNKEKGIDIAKEYNVSKSTISAIKLNKIRKRC